VIVTLSSRHCRENSCAELLRVLLRVHNITGVQFHVVKVRRRNVAEEIARCEAENGAQGVPAIDRFVVISLIHAAIIFN
jgi:hypothetical protein